MYQTQGSAVCEGYGQSRFVKFGKNYGLQYNPTVPPEAINKRPVYSYGSGEPTITNITNWQLSYQLPKARLSYAYDYINISDDVILYLRVKDGAITDISNNPVALTLNGTTVSNSIERIPGKGSIYTNGTGGLITAVDTKFQLGNQDFTVEFWQYSPSGATNADHLSSRTGANTNGFTYYGGNSYYSINGSSWTNTITGTYSANTWNHITTTRQGSTLYYFINGVLQGTSSVGTNNIVVQSQIAVGSTTLNANRVIAYYDDIRIIKGRALYTSNFSTNNIIEYP